MIERIRALATIDPATNEAADSARNNDMDWDAAVLLAITDSREPAIVFTRRSRHLNSHAGEVSFPGGKRESCDDHPIKTALRESEEEIGLAENSVRVLTLLDPITSKSGLRVLPVLGLIPERLEFQPCSHEAERVFQVPLRFFIDSSPSRHYKLSRDGIRLRIPSWDWGQEEIWGFTAMILVRFLAQIGHDGFGLNDLDEHPSLSLRSGEAEPARNQSTKRFNT